MGIGNYMYLAFLLSEPSNIQDLPLRTRANTHENVVHIKDSNVSIFSGESGMFSQ